MPHYTYIIKSDQVGSFYIGSASDVGRRLTKHNSGHSPYTSKKRPWKLFYYETFETKKEALIREKFLKKQRNKDFYHRLAGKIKNA